MGAEHRQHAHVFLRVVELMEAPEHADPVVRQVHEPVAPVHGHDDDGDGTPPRHRTDPGQHDPGGRGADDLHEREREPGHERHDDGRVQRRVEEVLAVPTGDQRSSLRRPHPFDDEEDADDRQRSADRSRRPEDPSPNRRSRPRPIRSPNRLRSGPPRRPRSQAREGRHRDETADLSRLASRPPRSRASGAWGRVGVMTTEDMMVAGWRRSALERRASGTRVRLLRAAGTALALHCGHRDPLPHLSLMFPFTWPGALSLTNQ